MANNGKKREVKIVIKTARRLDMSKPPIRVLHITEMLSAAGIESFIMNMYRNIDKDKVQFDFLVLRNQKEFYDEEISNLGEENTTFIPI